MSVQETKARIHELVDSAQDEAGLEAALAEANRLLALPQAEKDIWDDLTPAQQARLEASLEQHHQQGKVISHEEMQRHHSKWLNK